MSILWKLERYGRYESNKNGGKGGWEVYENSEAELNMTLTVSSFLVICHGVTVVESHSLVTARAWMRGLVKGDSMMFMYKIKGNTRRFRVKFKATTTETGPEMCDMCTSKLTKYFPVKITTETTNSQSLGATQDPELSGKEPEVITLDGQVTLSTMAQVLSGKLKANLPQAYKQQNYPTEETGMFLRLCLADPAFPEFVEHIDKELNKIINES